MLAAVGSILSSCAPASFTDVGSLSEDVQRFGSGTSPVVCDPFDAANIVKPTEGLKGSIHYLKASQPRYTDSADYIAHGTKVNVELFLSRVFVPMRVFDYGFVSDGGVPVKDDAGNLLVEYFGINLESKLKLGAADASGDYQLAVLSDDGSTLFLEDQAGTFQPVVQNEGAHAVRMGCASQVVAMDASTRLPMKLSYFQGPRRHIALVLMWRKIPAGATSLSDAECGQSGTNYFFSFDANTRTSVPQSPYQRLLARGWKPLSSDNFELKEGSNKCAP